MNIQPPAAARRSRFWRQLLVYGKWIDERERLPRDDEPSIQRIGASPMAWLTSPDQLPNRTGSGFGQRGLVPWLASREQLPKPTPSVFSQRGFVPWLASREQVPNLSESPRSRYGVLGWVTAREDLPTASSERTPPSRSIFRWLLTTEPHDRLENLHSIKEVPPHEP